MCAFPPATVVKAKKSNETTKRQRNLLILLGTLAERHAGPASEALFSLQLADCLLTFLQSDIAFIQLHALLAIEKFAKTGPSPHPPSLPILLFSTHPSVQRGIRIAASYCSAILPLAPSPRGSPPLHHRRATLCAFLGSNKRLLMDRNTAALLVKIENQICSQAGLAARVSPPVSPNQIPHFPSNGRSTRMRV